MIGIRQLKARSNIQKAELPASRQHIYSQESVSSSRPELQTVIGVLHNGTAKVIGYSRTISLAESIPTSDIPFDDSDMGIGWNTKPRCLMSIYSQIQIFASETRLILVFVFVF